MPKWNKDAKEFTVNVHYSDDKGTQIRVPKPILEKMGNPEKVTFVINGNNVKITPAENELKDVIKESVKTILEKKGKLKTTK